MKHQAGFVNIIGSPNVGKSTLMNALLGQKMSIISPKAQTTRHRILGFCNAENYQIIYSDTPGLLHPNYALQEAMMGQIQSALEDADVFILLTDIYQNSQKHQFDEKILTKIKNANVPILLLINKIDLLKNVDFLEKKVQEWHEILPEAEILPISALKKENIDWVLQKILTFLPEHPPYFDKEDLSDRNMRFFIGEMIREQIFFHYEKEIPYSCEVVVHRYQKGARVLEIEAEILVNRDSQKGILLGHKGERMKKLASAARQEIEKFLGQQIFLKIWVKADKNWREDTLKLKKYGYLSD